MGYEQLLSERKSISKALSSVNVTRRTPAVKLGWTAQVSEPLKSELEARAVPALSSTRSSTRGEHMWAILSLIAALCQHLSHTCMATEIMTKHQFADLPDTKNTDDQRAKPCHSLHDTRLLSLRFRTRAGAS